MASSSDSEIERTANAIDAYLDAHPSAADSAEGIARWWLADLTPVARELVELALEQLIERGKVSAKRMQDGTVVYSRA